MNAVIIVIVKDSVHEKASLLRDAVFAADDGMITTFAIAAGSAGAGFSPTTVIILGFANLIADGFSMAGGVYLGVKSELEYEKARGVGHNKSDSPVRDGVVTYISFVLAGLIPLAPYLLGVNDVFIISSLFVGVSLFLLGVIKGLYTDRNWIKSGLEVLFIGGLAAFLAYLVGYIVDLYII